MKTLSLIFLLVSGYTFATAKNGLNFCANNVLGDQFVFACTKLIQPNDLLKPSHLEFCNGFQSDNFKVQCVDFIRNKTFSEDTINTCSVIKGSVLRLQCLQSKNYFNEKTKKPVAAPNLDTCLTKATSHPHEYGYRGDLWSDTPFHFSFGVLVPPAGVAKEIKVSNNNAKIEEWNKTRSILVSAVSGDHNDNLYDFYDDVQEASGEEHTLDAITTILIDFNFSKVICKGGTNKLMTPEELVKFTVKEFEMRSAN